jgi:hypothetical protein
VGRAVWGIRAVGGAALAALLAAIGWLVAAAAVRPGPLSPPSVRGNATWTLGPLQGVLTSTAHGVGRLHTDFVLVLVVAGVAWVLAWWAADAMGPRVVLGAVAVLHLVLALAPPLSLTDVFNYELYARMASVHGLNPYRDLPAAVPGDPVYALSNWHHLSSPYGPLFTLGAQALTPLGPHGWLWAWKAIVVSGSLGLVALTGVLARRLGRSPARAMAVLGFSPLLLVFEVGGLHNDVPALLCLVGAVWCVVRGRQDEPPAWVDPLAGALVVMAAGIKPSFAIVVPLIVLGANGRLRAAVGAALVGLVAGLVVLFVYGGALPDVSTQGSIVTPVSVPNLLGLAAGHGGADPAVRALSKYLLVAAGLVAAALVAWRRSWMVPALVGSLLVAILALSWVMPWYLVWALPFVGLLARPRLLAPLVVLATAWLCLGSASQLPSVLHSFGYYPTRLETGKANHDTFRRLVR